MINEHKMVTVCATSMCGDQPPCDPIGEIADASKPVCHGHLYNNLTHPEIEDMDSGGRRRTAMCMNSATPVILDAAGHRAAIFKLTTDDRGELTTYLQLVTRISEASHQACSDLDHSRY